jgi:hypothetical protein
MLFILFEIIYEIDFFFNFILFQFFYRLDLVFIFLLLFILYEIIYKIELLFIQIHHSSTFLYVRFGSHFSNKLERKVKTLISCFSVYFS